MIFFVDTRCNQKFMFDLARVGARVMRTLLKEEGFPYRMGNGHLAAEVSLLLTDDDGIRELNAQYREKDAVTDVLSFPSVTYPAPADFTALKDTDAYHTDSGRYYLGDIVLNAARVKSQAFQYGHSEKREAAFLIAHSLLHLIGYDHETKEEERIMEEKQEAVLERLGILREHA